MELDISNDAASTAEGSGILAAYEPQSNGVYAVAETRRRWAIFKYVSKMSTTSLTHCLSSNHTMAAICCCFNAALGNR
jgi:hypothetical protein